MAEKELFGNSEQLKLDTISRAAALKTAEWVYRACEDNLSYYHDLLVAALMDLTPAQPGWIPCKERLPEYDGEYMVTKKTFGWNCEEYAETDIARYEKKNGWHKADQVIAWMPLPEPYQEGEREKAD